VRREILSAIEVMVSAAGSGGRHRVVSFIGRGRPERTVPVQPIGARQAVQRLAEIEAREPGDESWIAVAAAAASGPGARSAP